MKAKMNISKSPVIKTQVVGSYPVPGWLQALPSAPNLRDAMLTIIKTQELAGLDIISDGELSRFDPNHPETNGMIEYFIRPLDGITQSIGLSERQAYQQAQGMQFRSRPPGMVIGPIGEGSLDLKSSWESMKPLAQGNLMFTLTSPYMLAKTLHDKHYGNLRDLTMGLASVLADQVTHVDAPMVQIDEANLPGHPEDADWFHEPLNLILDRIQGERALHLCFGNYGGQQIQTGHWKNLVTSLNRLKVDHLVLECSRLETSQLESLKDIRQDLALGIGVIDIKANLVESADVVARRIEEATRKLGPERVQWVHPDCGFWMLPRSVADRKMKQLVAGRDLHEGRSVH